MSQKQVKRMRVEARRVGARIGSRRVLRALLRERRTDPAAFDITQVAARETSRGFIAKIRNLTPAQAEACLKRLREQRGEEDARGLECVLRALGKIKD